MNSLMSYFNDPPKKRFEKRPCANCGAEFEAKIYILKDRELDADRLCKTCAKAKADQEALTAANEELKLSVQAQRERWKKAYGVSGVFLEKTFDNFDSKIQPGAYQAVKSFNGNSLVLLSPEIYGVGKTHLVSALANYLVTSAPPAALDSALRIRTFPCPVYFTVEASLLARIRDTFNNQGPTAETEEKVYRSLASYPLLIIDDVGKIKPQDMSFTQSVYFRIIDLRYTEHKQIIITTNLDAAGLGNHIGGACLDRLFEMAGAKGFITLKGQSYRRKGVA